MIEHAKSKFNVYSTDNGIDYFIYIMFHLSSVNDYDSQGRIPCG